MAGLNNSIFNLPNSLEEIRRPEDVIKIYTRKVIAKASSTGSSFPGSDVTFDFSLSGNQYWLPSRSFVVIRDAINLGVGDEPRKPTLEGNAAGTTKVAPAFNCQDNLFDGCELTIGGFSMGSKTKLAPQISVCEKRLSKSSSHLESANYGASTWKPSFGDRLQDVVRNGSYESPRDERPLTGTIIVVADSAALVGAGTAFLDELQPGSMLRTQTGQMIQIKSVADATNATITSSVNTAEGANTLAYVIGERFSNRANLNERLYQPPLGVFKQGKA